MNIPYFITDLALTVYLDGEAISVPRDWDKFDQVVDLLNDPSSTKEAARSLLNGFMPNAQIAMSDTNKGKVVVTRRGVTFNGAPVHNSLARRMIDIVNTGLDIDPWIAFMENLMLNPAEHAREELYDWMSGSDLPITDDGCFLAFKRVRGDFKDCHTGTMDNSPGTTVVMPGGRKAVDADRHRTCSTGLHFCSKGYLSSFNNGGTNKTVLVKVNPADVVAIPSDYNNQKGRAWQYEVLQEVGAEVDPQSIDWEGNEVAFAPEPEGDEAPEWFNFEPDGTPVSRTPPRRITITIDIDGDDDGDDEDQWEEYYGDESDWS